MQGKILRDWMGNPPCNRHSALLHVGQGLRPIKKTVLQLLTCEHDVTVELSFFAWLIASVQINNSQTEFKDNRNNRFVYFS